MQKAGLGLALALAACAQITLVTTPALADDASAASGAPAASDSTSTSSDAAATTPPPPPADNAKKKTTGIILAAGGGALTITGIVFDAIGATAGHVSGAGASTSAAPGGVGIGTAGDNGQTSNARANWIFAGTTLIVVGLATGLYGGSMILAANKGEDTKASAPRDSASSDQVTRAIQAQVASAPAFMMPVLSGKF